MTSPAADTLPQGPDTLPQGPDLSALLAPLASLEPAPAPADLVAFLNALPPTQDRSRSTRLWIGLLILVLTVAAEVARRAVASGNPVRLAQARRIEIRGSSSGLPMERK